MEHRRMKGLLRKTFTSFAMCCLILFAVTAPLFYLVTRHFYAEDLADIINAVNSGETLPPLDLDHDIMEGVMLQFMLIFAVVSIALFVTMRFVTKRIWQPFEDTLRKTEKFNVSQDEIPAFTSTDVLEFNRLNTSLRGMMERSRETYRIQKEFTENASHELQTPLAVTRSKLDLLMQEELTRQQLSLISDLYSLNTRMEHLNRNLLLLAKIENSQYDVCERIDLPEFITRLLPSYNLLKGGSRVLFTDSGAGAAVTANSILLECMLNNLVVNALRHAPDGDVMITLAAEGAIEVSNAGNGTPLNADEIFRRFHSGSTAHTGTGLGLAIVKAICDFHKWGINYSFRDNRHIFRVGTSAV